MPLLGQGFEQDVAAALGGSLRTDRWQAHGREARSLRPGTQTAAHRHRRGDVPIRCYRWLLSGPSGGHSQRADGELSEMASGETGNEALERQTAAAAAFMNAERFRDIRRLHTAREVAAQRGSIPQEYTVARDAAEAFHARLRELFEQRKSITTFGPYSPGQATAMKRRGIEGIYIGGWATSAKGSITEDPGPRSRQLSPEPGAGRGGARRARPAHGRQEPDLHPFADERGGAAGDPGDGLSTVHRRRRGHGPRRRTARAQPDPPLRRGGRARLPHRGPEARRQEVRPSGGQGARAAGTNRTSA